MGASDPVFPNRITLSVLFEEVGEIPFPMATTLSYVPAVSDPKDKLPKKMFPLPLAKLEPA